MPEDNTIITYETLYEILRKEKIKPELQELEEDFFKKVTKYLEEKKSILESQKLKESIFTSIEIQKTSRQIENILRIIKDLYERRESKIIQLAAMHSKNNTSHKERSIMLREEKKFFDSILKILDVYREGILNNLLSGKIPTIKQEPKDLKTDFEAKKKNKKIMFKELVPQFVGLDLNTYGPYEKEDTEDLPEEVANLLIKRNVAEQI